MHCQNGFDDARENKFGYRFEVSGKDFKAVDKDRC